MTSAITAAADPLPIILPPRSPGSRQSRTTTPRQPRPWDSLSEPPTLYTRPQSPPAAIPGGPSLARKAANFSKAIIKHAVAGLPQADQATADARLAICRECESFDAQYSRCRSCGCQLQVKVYWSEQKCPIGKW